MHARNQLKRKLKWPWDALLGIDSQSGRAKCESESIWWRWEGRWHVSEILQSKGLTKTEAQGLPANARALCSKFAARCDRTGFEESLFGLWRGWENYDHDLKVVGLRPIQRHRRREEMPWRPVPRHHDQPRPAATGQAQAEPNLHEQKWTFDFSLTPQRNYRWTIGVFELGIFCFACDDNEHQVSSECRRPLLRFQ